MRTKRVRHAINFPDNFFAPQMLVYFSSQIFNMTVYGAGAQQSDPKIGNPGDFLNGRGPQGDVILIYNYIRCVRGGLSGL